MPKKQESRKNKPSRTNRISPTAQKKERSFRIPFIIISLAALTALAWAVTGYRLWYEERVFPGVQVSGRSLRGMTSAELQPYLQGLVDEANERGWTFTYQDAEPVAITPVVVSGDIDTSYEIVSYNVEAMSGTALRIGRTGSAWQQLAESVGHLFRPRNLQLATYVNEEELTRILQENFQQHETLPTDALFVHQEDGTLIVGEAAGGQVFPYESVVATFADRVQSHTFEPISLNLIEAAPAVTVARATQLLPEAQQLQNGPPLTVSFVEHQWEFGPEVYRSWIQPVAREGGVVLTFHPAAASDVFQSIRDAVEVPMQLGQFEISNGRVTQFVPSQTGVSIDLEATLDRMFAQLAGVPAHEGTDGTVAGVSDPVQLSVREEHPPTQTGDVNDFGITELIGEGRSDFSGSPVNRRKNIAIGATMLHGQLIPPGEEFSLVEALGRFDPADGWLPELVIKGNKTIPEIGGGACQFGTTMFRATIDTGLPITARRNHSYTVSYYYPIGTDATIYDPAPDYKFMNDTGHHILIQARIEGDELIFEFWGTRDGRVATKTDPVLSNWVSPPPKKLIETEDLAPGQVKCTEKAHQGVTAAFDYRVDYGDGRVIDETYRSVYKPWQEVCLVGKTPEPEPVADEPAEEPAYSEPDTQGNPDTNSSPPANTNSTVE